MPRRNKPKPKPQRKRGLARQQGLHKKMDSPGIRRTSRWLEEWGRA